MKREFHKKDKNRAYEKKKDKASVRKESIARKMRLKNDLKQFDDNSSSEFYNRKYRDIDDLYNT